MTSAATLRDTDAIVLIQKRTESAAATYDYVISGLLVRSQIEFPSAIPAASSDANPDVTIVEGDVPEVLPDAASFDDGYVQIAGERVQCTFPRTMRVLVQAGRHVTVDRFAESMHGDVVMFLLGTTFGIILQQRDRIVLHASAVAVGDEAMLFCGPSGAGKSTMAAMLSRRGYPLLNDDVCNLSRGIDGTYTVYPDGRMLKLWSQSLQHLAVQPDEAHRIRSDAEKFYVAPERVDLTPRSVGAVYTLALLENDAAPSLTKLSAAEAMVELTINAYRPGLVRAMKMQAEYFKAFASIAAKSGVYRLSRVKDFSRTDEVLDLLENSWAAGAQKRGA